MRRDALLIGDPERARRNREMVARKENTAYYEWLAEALRKTPKKKALPQYMPELTDSENLERLGGGEGS